METETPTIKTPLRGHTSPETAFVSEDYPYGFRLRCKMRFWIEEHPKRGFRACRQSTNPKKSYEHWNKPKKSTYSDVCEGMYLDEKGHVQFCALTKYSHFLDSLEFKQRYWACLGDAARESLDLWISMQKIYEREKARGHVTIQFGNEEPQTVY